MVSFKGSFVFCLFYLYGYGVVQGIFDCLLVLPWWLWCRSRDLLLFACFSFMVMVSFKGSFVVCLFYLDVYGVVQGIFSNLHRFFFFPPSSSLHCAKCCLFFWIVLYWLPHRCSLRFGLYSNFPFLPISLLTLVHLVYLRHVHYQSISYHGQINRFSFGGCGKNAGLTSVTKWSLLS